jgi:prepilin-type N-terminal cleavage/methylation domain-containing protein
MLLRKFKKGGLMNLPKRNNNEGFTIIEVVLVLAIAGLIFLMIFIAFPALQRNQADSQRRSDVGRVISQVTQYQTDNRGSIPNANNVNGAFKNNYLKSGNETFADPSGSDYTLVFKSGATDGTAKPAKGQMYYHSSATCSNSSGNAVASSSRKVAVRVTLDGGAVYCQNN